MGVRKRQAGVLLEDFHLEGLPPALGLTDFKGDTVGLRESEKAVVRDVRPVKEDIFDALGFNEPVLLLLIVPLHFAFEHFPPLSSNLELAANSVYPEVPSDRNTLPAALRHVYQFAMLRGKPQFAISQFTEPVAEFFNAIKPV